MDRLDRTGLVAPVGHHDTLETPLVTKNRRQQVMLLLGIFPVEFVVRRHDRPRIGLLDHDLETLQHHLTQGARIDDGVVLVAVGLLVVRREMLGTHANPIALDTVDIRRSNLAGQERILGKILEIPAAERVAVQVHTRSKQHVGAILLNLLSHRLGHFLDQRGIERSRHHRTHRETGRIEGLVGTRTRRINTDTSRTVRKDRLRNAQPRDGASRTGRTGNEGRIRRRQRASDHAAPAGTDQQGRLFFEGHRLQDLFNIVLAELRLADSQQGAEGSTQGKQYFLHRTQNEYSVISFDKCNK